MSLPGRPKGECRSAEHEASRAEAPSTAGCVDHIRRAVPGFAPRVAVLLGSGWGGFTDHLHDAVRIPYGALEGFGGEAGVAGHAGQMCLGRLGGQAVAVLSGRRHAYETGQADAMKQPLRVLRALGCEVLVQTNAAGSLDPAVGPGRVVMVADHINFAQRSPLVGEPGNDRFVDLNGCYDEGLRAAARAVAARRGTELTEGVYLWTLGPQFETPAEIRMYRAFGADLVGMSTVPETIIARHAGLKVLAFSLVTNLAAGLCSQTLSHEHTLAQARAAGDEAGAFLADVVTSLVG